MAASSQDFGQVDEIDAEAIGQPGQRTFRLLIEREGTSGSFWMEKEQLEQIAVIIEQQLAQVRPTRTERPGERPTLAANFPARATFDFRVGRMAIGFDPEERRFAFTAQPIENPDELELSWVATQEQAEQLSRKILTVAAAGRPRCPLCGAPVEGHHVCPKANGHVHG